MMKAKSSVINELRGTLNKGKDKAGLTARTYKDKGIVISNKPVPTDHRTTAQASQRDEYKAGCEYWQTLSDYFKAPFVLEAKARDITPFNAFMSGWLNPTVYRADVTADSYVYESDPDVNYGSSTSAILRDQNAYNRYIFAKWNMPDWEKVGLVKSATMYIHAYVYYNADPQGKYLRPFRIPSDWEENVITWNNMPTPDHNFGTTELPATPPCWYDIDVTEEVKAYHGWPNLYFGIGISFWPIDNASPSNVYYRAKEYSNPAYRPYIEMEIAP